MLFREMTVGSGCPSLSEKPGLPEWPLEAQRSHGAGARCDGAGGMCEGVGVRGWGWRWGWFWVSRQCVLSSAGVSVNCPVLREVLTNFSLMPVCPEGQAPRPAPGGPLFPPSLDCCIGTR